MAAIAAPVREPQSNLGLVAALGGALLAAAAAGAGVAFGELQAAYVGLSLIACAAVIYDFRFGAVAMCLMLPVAESSLFPRGLFGIVGLTPLNLVTVATLASFILHGRTQPRAGALASKQLVWLYVLPLALAGLMGSRHAGEVATELYDVGAIHFTNSVSYLAELVVKPLMMVLISLLVGAAAARSNKPERFLIPMGIAMWLMCYLSISFAVRSSLTLEELSSASTRGFFSGTGLHANDLGRLYAAAYALLLFAWHESRNATFRLACLATMGVVIVALVFTFSRGAFLGFIVVNGLFFLWRFNMKTAALALLAGIVLVAVLPEAVFQRAMFGVGTDTNTVTAGRLDDIWIPLMPELFKSPIWGSGLGSIMWSDAMRRGTMAVVEHPHNAYLEAFVDVGIVGIALIVGFYLHVWKRFRELGSNPYLSPELRGFFKGAAAALIAFFVTGVAGSSFAPRPEWAFLWLAIGMMYGQLARKPVQGHA